MLRLNLIGMALPLPLGSLKSNELGFRVNN
jgi:hypothetical protein